MRQLSVVACLVVLAACTPVSSDDAANGPSRDDARARTAGSTSAGVTRADDIEPGCKTSSREGADAPTAAFAPTELRSAARWSKRVDAIGGYAHRVAIDDDGNIVWAHDSGTRQFTVTKLDAQGERLWHRELEPAGLEPEALHATSDGAVLVGGPDLSGGPDGPKIVKLDADGEIAWELPVPRVRVRRFDETADGRVVVLAGSGRQQVDLAGWHMSNQWLPPGGSMDIILVLGRDGSIDWARAYLPGAMGMVVHDDAIYLGGNFGRASVDYGRGAVDGPGVLAKLTLDLQHVWSRSLKAGLRGVIGTNDGLHVVGFPGPGHGDATWVAPVDDRGCPGPHVTLGHAATEVLATPGGSYVTYGWSPSAWDLLDSTVPPSNVESRGWLVAKLSAQHETQWLYTIDCDDLHAAAGPHDTVAITCFTSLSDTRPLKRRYELFVK